MDQDFQKDKPGLPANDSRAAGVSAVPAMKERRRSVRFLCTGNVELQADGSDARVWGKLADASLHGCRVETSTTFAVGTKVTLVMEALGVRVRTPATIRVSYLNLGMGICFQEPEPEQQTQLQKLIKALVGQRAILNNSTAEQDGLSNNRALGKSATLL